MKTDVSNGDTAATIGDSGQAHMAAIGSLGGLAAAAKLTPEQRSQRARAAVNVRWQAMDKHARTLIMRKVRRKKDQVK